jgi:hypothetical protein
VTGEVAMKKFLSLALILVFASFASAETWFKGSLNDAIAKAKAKNKLVLLDFFSAG